MQQKHMYRSPSLDAIIAYLKSSAAQDDRIPKCLAHKEESYLYHIFEEFNGYEHPDVEEVLDYVATTNGWDRPEEYLNDILLIAFNELFDENGKLREEIKAAINSSDTETLNKLKSQYQSFNAGILGSYASKMFLNTAEKYLKEKAMADETFLMLFSYVNQNNQKLVEDIDFEATKTQMERSRAFAKKIHESFSQLNLKTSNYPESLSNLLEELGQIIRSAQNFILPYEIRKCENLIAQIMEIEPNLLGGFTQIVDQAYELSLKKPRKDHKAHSDKAYHGSIEKHDLLQELQQLFSDLSEEISLLKEGLTVYRRAGILDEEAQQKLRLITDNLAQLENDVDSIDEKIKNKQINFEQMIRLKLEIMIHAIDLSRSEFLLQELDLSTRLQSDSTAGTKRESLMNFRLNLEDQKKLIKQKLDSGRPLTREDIDAPIQIISAKKEEMKSSASTHSFWLFRLLSKLRFHIPTRTEKMIESAEKRLEMGKAPR